MLNIDLVDDFKNIFAHLIGVPNGIVRFSDNALLQIVHYIFLFLLIRWLLLDQIENLVSEDVKTHWEHHLDQQVVANIDYDIAQILLIRKIILNALVLDSETPDYEGNCIQNWHEDFVSQPEYLIKLDIEDKTRAYLDGQENRFLEVIVAHDLLPFLDIYEGQQIPHNDER